MQLKIDNKVFTILNVYTPYECQENEDVYLNSLALNQFIHDNQSSVFVVADMNADFSDKRSIFDKHMSQFCDVIIQPNAFTSRQLLLHKCGLAQTSWLDHYKHCRYSAFHGNLK